MAHQLFLLSEDAVQAIEKDLKVLLTDTKSRYALVIDRSGYLLASCGQPAHVHPEELSAIAAGIVSAMQVIVNLAESEESTIAFHSRTMADFHIAWINPRVFLLLAFNGQSSEVIVRGKARQAARAIAPLLAQDQTQPADLGSVEFIESKLSELFKDM